MAADSNFGAFKTKGNGAVPEAPKNPKSELKKKQKASISEEFNQPDPIGDAVRSLYKKVRGV